MEYRPIEVNLICAKDLKDVNVLSTMDVYVVCSVSGDPRSTQRSPVDKGGGTNPRFNHRMKFTFDESAARLNRLGLVFQLTSNRTLGDKEIGRVYVPLKELLDAVDLAGKNGVSGEEKFLTYQVQTPSGKFKGVLEFSYKFGDKFTKTVDRRLDDPVLAYPPGHNVPAPGPSSYPGPGYGYGYPPPPPPPPPPNYGYGYPGPGQGSGGYGYPGPGQGPGGYGYPGPGQCGYGYQGQGQGSGPGGYGYSGRVGPKRGSRMGMGTTAMGVGAGLLGGFLVGEMVDDMAQVAAYDDMMDDGGGVFDF